MSPRLLFRVVAVAEAITWALLLTGMVLKYGTETTEVGVQVFGMVHGIAFVAYCLAVFVVGIDRPWSFGVADLALIASVFPFATVFFDLWVERTDRLGDQWRLATEPGRGVERPVGWLVRHPLPGLAAGVVAVAALTGVALALGPPA